MKEIERKFLIKSLPENLEQYSKKEIEQGYFDILNPVLRIRKYNNEYILCHKFRDKNNTSKASICEETELPLNFESYNCLKKKIDGRILTKTRYIIPLQNNLKAELDDFHGYLEGLIVVEVEFKNENDANNFMPPEWFGEDVSFDKRYKNSKLCMASDNDICKLLNKGV